MAMTMLTPAMLTPMQPWIQFLEPNKLYFLLTIPVLVAAYALLLRRRAGRTPHDDMLGLVLPKDSPWKRHVAVAMALLSLVTLTVAWARPKQDVEVPKERATIVVVIDVSLSMQAEDVKPNRLAAARDAAKAFVTSLPRKFNVSLVAFAGTSQIVVPPTTDRGAVTAGIDNLVLMPATAIGEGIYSGLDSLLQVPPDPEDPTAEVPARMVLLSDGKTTVGRPATQAARQAKDQKVPVYTIAYGTENGTVEINGRREAVPVDHDELAAVAKISGGKAYAAQSAGQLNDVYKDIGSSVGKEKVDMEVTSRYAGLGLLFAVLASLGVASLGARWP